MLVYVHIISLTQTAFMKGWNILEGVFTLSYTAKIKMESFLELTSKKNNDSTMFILVTNASDAWKGFHLNGYPGCFPSYIYHAEA